MRYSIVFCIGITLTLTGPLTLAAEEHASFTPSFVERVLSAGFQTIPPPWIKNKVYFVGNNVSYQESVWRADRETITEPSSKNKDWSEVVLPPALNKEEAKKSVIFSENPHPQNQNQSQSQSQRSNTKKQTSNSKLFSKV